MRTYSIGRTELIYVVVVVGNDLNHKKHAKTCITVCIPHLEENVYSYCVRECVRMYTCLM